MIAIDPPVRLLIFPLASKGPSTHGTEGSFATPLAAKRAIADEIRLPIGKLSEDDRQFIDALVARTLSRPEVITAVRQRFPQGRKGGVGSC